MKRWQTVTLYLIVGLGLALLAAALLASPAPQAAFFSGITPPLVIAHQGGDGLRPGDTLAAFENAARLGVDVLEMDVHASRDGVLVVMHDATVDRTTDGSGALKEMTLEQIKTLDAGYNWSPDGGLSYPYRGQDIRVPTLEEVFQAFPGYRMNIEIKQTEPSIAAALCDLIRQYHMLDRVLVASFHAQAMSEFRAACPEVATSMHEDEIRPLYFLARVGLAGLVSPAAQAVQVPEYWGNIHVLVPSFVRGAQRRGVQVHAWTINEPADMQRLLDLGVDGIITDYPDRLLDLLGR
ncbi:MAG: glycerophosphodiester phosphodiesterase [Anaerolineae bacterium]|nr:MAG: glycerophosphodiester phosphodiesterase [Anaerolineae bacterium]